MILETKLTMPQPKAGALVRKNLIDLIKNNLDKKLILITAGAGYGKTTLLGQLVKAAKLPAVFYLLDQGDSDLLTFYSYLVAGLEKLSPGLAGRSAVLLTQAGQIGSNHELLMGTLINELVEKRKEELFFILDDYQHLTENSPVHQALDFFIDHMPETVHVIIASRTAVRFANYAKWYAKQNAMEIGRNQMLFSPEDISELLRLRCNRTVSDAELKQVWEHTRGWITGVQLIFLQPLDEGLNRTIGDLLADCTKAGTAAGGLFDYFSKQILSAAAPEEREFLIKSSMLETMTPGACDAIMKITDSQRILAGLVRRNMFVTKAGACEYLYHSLFRDFLGRLADENDKTAVHMSAAAYYSDGGDLERALDHYLEARDYKQARRLLHRVYVDMLAQAKITRLSGWLEKFPKNEYARDPNLHVTRGFVLSAAGKGEEALQEYLRAEAIAGNQRTGKRRSIQANILYARAEIAYDNGLSNDACKMLRAALNLCAPGQSELKVDILNLLGMAYKFMNNQEQARRSYAKALKYAGKLHGSSCAYRLTILANQAFLWSNIGEYRKASQAYQELLLNADVNYTLTAGRIFSQAADNAFAVGDDDLAERYITKGFSVCTAYYDPKSILALDVARGMLYYHRNELPRALEIMEKVKQECNKLQLPYYMNAIRKLMARIYIQMGNVADARRCLDESGKIPPRGNKPAVIQAKYIEAQLAVAEGRPADALALIKAVARYNMKNGFMITAFCAQLIEVNIYLSQGRKKQALRLLSQVMATARAKGCDGPLIRALRNNPALAELAWQQPGYKKYLARIKSRALGESRNAGCGTAIQLDIRLLGPLQLCLADGREIPLKWRYTKSASLLAYLLLHRERVCLREELMECLWPRVAAVKAEGKLSDSVYFLKKTLSTGFKQVGQLKLSSLQFVEHLEKGYRLASFLRCRLDVEEFAAIFERAQQKKNSGSYEECLQDYRRCLDLYQSDFLTNVGDQWCEEFRRRNQKMRLEILQKLAAASLEASEYAKALDYCRSFLEADPYSEQMHVMMWKALAGMGRQTEIQKDYLYLRRLLWKDLREKMQPETHQEFKLQTRVN